MANSQESNIIELISWSPIATWSFKSLSTDCSICRELLMRECTECTTKPITQHKKTCIVSKGICGHCFHDHCISKWLTGAITCPICTTPYKTEITNMDDKFLWKNNIEKKSGK